MGKLICQSCGSKEIDVLEMESNELWYNCLTCGYEWMEDKPSPLSDVLFWVDDNATN